MSGVLINTSRRLAARLLQLHRGLVEAREIVGRRGDPWTVLDTLAPVGAKTADDLLRDSAGR